MGRKKKFQILGFYSFSTAFYLCPSVNWIWEEVLADNIDFNYMKREDIEGLLKEKEEKRKNVEKC